MRNPITITGTDQAANTEVSETVTARQIWRLRNFTVTLVADANVANRVVTLIVKDASGNEVLRFVAGTNITAGQTVKIEAAAFTAAPSDVAGTVVYLKLPQDFVLGTGWTIETSTASKQVGDNYGAPIMIVEKQIY